jgi:hypothetical protein
MARRLLDYLTEENAHISYTLRLKAEDITVLRDRLAVNEAQIARLREALD